MIEDLKFHEILFLEILRAFNYYLNGNYYNSIYIALNTVDGCLIDYRNTYIKQSIYIEYFPEFHIRFIRKQKGFDYTSMMGKKDMFDLIEIKNLFPEYRELPTQYTMDNSLEFFKKYADFLKNELEPIVKGEMWIDKLLKIKGLI